MAVALQCQECGFKYRFVHHQDSLSIMIKSEGRGCSHKVVPVVEAVNTIFPARVCMHSRAATPLTCVYPIFMSDGRSPT